MTTRPYAVAILLFLTLVGTGAFASPHDDAPPPTDKAAETQDIDTEDPVLLENTSITEVPVRSGRMQEFVQRFDRQNYYHAYRQSVTAHLGSVIALKDSTDSDSLMSIAAGFLWQPKKQFSPMWEYGATWVSSGLGQILATRKHVTNEKGAFRPFYKYGVGLKIDPDEQAANLVDFDNLMLRAGVGLENILKPPRSVRMDLDLVIGKDDMWIVFLYGYSWGI